MTRAEDVPHPSFDGLVCDMDGVLYRGDEPVPGAADAIARVRRAGIAVVFCTNNSHRTPRQYVVRLEAMGIDATEHEVVTSAVALGEVLAQRGAEGNTAIVVGGDGINESLAGAGVEIAGDGSERADLVVVGFDPTFDWQAMKRAARAVLGGAKLIATNEDATFPAADGLWPGAGAILASIEAASGGRAEVMGKPHRPLMEIAAAHLAAASGRPQTIAMVGDRPDTDIDGARAMGWTAILVLSGVTDAGAARALDPQPDAILGSLADLRV